MLSTRTRVLSSGWVYSGSSLSPTRIQKPNFPFEGIFELFGKVPLAPKLKTQLYDIIVYMSVRARARSAPAPAPDRPVPGRPVPRTILYCVRVHVRIYVRTLALALLALRMCRITWLPVIVWVYKPILGIVHFSRNGTNA